ncbi:MAG: lipoprotein insertase outer membrane protein LolB [Gallionella sp.]
MIRYWLMALLLTGCATMPPLSRPVQPEAVPFAMNGRISVKHNGARDSAGLRWTHQDTSDEILLLTPLGQTAARIYRDDAHATLDNGDKHYSDTDVESLMQQVLGWRLQLDHLHHWVLGLTVPGDAMLERDTLGRLTVLRQDGWEVRYMAYSGDKADSLPVRMKLSRANLEILLLIDECEWNPK